jgi:hypothetical protein
MRGVFSKSEVAGPGKKTRELENETLVWAASVP